MKDKTIEDFKITAENSNSFRNNINTSQNELSAERNNLKRDNIHESANLSENKKPTVGSMNDHSFANRLHKTLKSILPNANISFGNYNNSNKPYQAINSVASSNFRINDGKYLWSDDPAIVSLTDKFDSNSNINNLVNFLGINNIQYSNYLGDDILLNKNDTSSTYFYNTYSNSFCPNNTDQYSDINGENVSNEISNNDKNNNHPINKFQDESDNILPNSLNKNSNINTCLLKKDSEPNENELLDVNRNSQFNFIKNLNTNICSNNNIVNSQNDMFFNYCENNSYAIYNHSNNTNSLNNNLSLQQHMFIQQLTANLTSNNKLPTEFKK